MQIYKLTVAADYVEAIANEDISKADGVDKEPDRVKALLRSISRGISCETKIVTLVNDLAVNLVKQTGDALQLWHKPQP